MAANNDPFIPGLVIHPDASEHRYIHVIGTKVFIDDRPAEDGWDHHFLGMHGSVAVWGIDVPHGQDPAYGAETDLYSLFGRVSETDWAVAGRAVQIVEWARTHRYCGRCGEKTRLADNERAFVCPSCRLMNFPRLAPAIITLVTRGDEALLARGVQFRAPMYSTLAGFVEAGESMEDAVHREVREEVGVEITNIRYWGSQPWPFPHSLMVGFRAEWTSGHIEIDPSEIVDAQWYTRDSLPPIPPGISIARKLIDAWLAEG